MQRFRVAWNRHHAATPRDGVFGLDREADLKSANIITNLFIGRTVSERSAERLALVLHYAYGAAAGVGYVLWIEASPAARTSYGTLFGTVLWLLGDELPIALSGLSNPFARSHRSHLSALVAHLIFGSVTESVRKVLKR